MMITFRAFQTAINTLVFPDGMAEHRVPFFRNLIVNALIQLQTYVESYQLVNVSFYDKDQSFDDCNLSIIQGCRGRIGGLYAFKPSCRCQRYFYEPASLEKLSCLYENCKCQIATACCGQATFATPSPYISSPYYCGDRVEGNTGCRPPYLAQEPEDDCAFKLSEKYYAVGPNQKIWLYPRWPCGYLVAVHWTGIRRSYLDTDYVLDDDDLKDAVACYVESEVARRIDKDQATADKLYADYRMKAGDIIFREESDLKPRATRLCIEGLDQSELVQIYPDNPYPTYVGESCAQRAGQPTGGEETTPEPGPFEDTDTLFWWPLEEASGNRVDVVHGVELVPNNEIHMMQDDAYVSKGVRFVPNVNSEVILQSAATTDLAYAGGGFDFMFWLRINVYGASSQILVPRFRLYDVDDNVLASFTLDCFSASFCKIFASNNGESLDLDSPTIPGVGEWHMFRVFYDDADQKVGIQVDNGPESRSDPFTNPMPNAAKAQLGIWHLGSGGGSQDNFLADELVARIGALFSSAERDSYYNSGTGRTF